MQTQSTVLVTGFAPWAAHTINPSTSVAQALDGVRVDGIVFRAFAPLPVAFGKAAELALARADELGAVAIVSFGLAAATPFVRVEAQAKNAISSSDPDAHGESRIGERIAERHGEELLTRFDVAAVAHGLRSAGIDARISSDAGGYVCNDLYFRLLMNATVPVLFVHVPSDAHALTKLPPALATTLASEVARLQARA